MTTQKNWWLITTIVVYWLVLASSILAFVVLYIGVGMTPGNYNMKTGEALVFLTFPAALLGCKFVIFKLRGAQDRFRLLSLAAIIPLIQIWIVFVLI